MAKKNKNNFGFKSQPEMFLHVWNTRPHICELTGVPLNFVEGGDEWFCCMAHLLRKGVFTYFKLNPDNVMLLHPDVHSKMDNWLPEYDREMYNRDKWETKVEEMKTKYNEYKLKNLLA